MVERSISLCLYLFLSLSRGGSICVPRPQYWGSPCISLFGPDPVVLLPAEIPLPVGLDRLLDEVVAQYVVRGDQIGRVPPLVPVPLSDLCAMKTTLLMGTEGPKEQNT